MAVLAAALAAGSPVAFDFLAANPSTAFGGGLFGAVTAKESGHPLPIVRATHAGRPAHGRPVGHADNAVEPFALGDPDLSLGNAKAGFAVFDTPNCGDVFAPALSAYSTALDCADACGPCGGGDSSDQPASFIVTASNGPLSFAPPGYGSGGGQSLYSASGFAGSAGGKSGSAGDITSPVPEPASWAMMAGGFALVGAAIRRRRKPAGRHVRA